MRERERERKREKCIYIWVYRERGRKRERRSFVINEKDIIIGDVTCQQHRRTPTTPTPDPQAPLAQSTNL